MTARSRSPFAFAILLGLGIAAHPAQAQDAASREAVSPAPTPSIEPTGSAPVSSETRKDVSAAVPAGPTMQAATAAVRHIDDHTVAPAPRRGGNAPGVPLMIVGGAAIIGGLVVGGGAGDAIAVGGLLIGLYGLYQYLQ